MEEANLDPVQVIPAQQARQISDILSDPSVRNSSLNATIDNLGKQVAVKTGTTNDFRDVWVEGFTPNLVVGAWAGKNDNSPMNKKVAGLVVVPVWGAFMTEINDQFAKESFKKPDPVPTDIKPVLRGIWKGGVSYQIDSISGKVATNLTPEQTRQEVVFPNVHTILNWLNKDTPRDDIKGDPKSDSQYEYWEYGVRKWFDNWQKNNPNFKETNSTLIPTETDNVHIDANIPKISIDTPKQDEQLAMNSRVSIKINYTGKYPIKKLELYINDKYISSTEGSNTTISFIPADIGDIQPNRNTIKVVSYDTVFNRSEAFVDITITQ